MTTIQFLQQLTLARDVLLAVIGLFVGSFLNVLALRSLKEQSIIFPPSHCPNCDHRLGIMDLVPVLSYLMLRGRCRYCHQPISWQYPIVEVLTAAAFVILIRYFGFTVEGIGMVIFACTLIAVCVTDFREKLIPHEITYPSMLMGIIFSGAYASLAECGIAGPGLIKHDLIGSLAGIGISYMLFDFIAFYGLLAYKKMYGSDRPDEADEQKKNEPQAADEDADDQIDTTFNIEQKREDEEEFEVMGGGDAVLGAVIASWLGLSRLGTALLFGFVIGTVLGAVYLFIELKRQNLLGKCVVPVAIGMSIMLLLSEGMVYFIAQISQQPFLTMPWWQFGTVAAVCGGLLGVVTVGSRVSKPFPFGPALAAGAVVAMFVDPFTGMSGGA